MKISINGHAPNTSIVLTPENAAEEAYLAAVYVNALPLRPDAWFNDPPRDTPRSLVLRVESKRDFSSVPNAVETPEKSESDESLHRDMRHPDYDYTTTIGEGKHLDYEQKEIQALLGDMKGRGWTHNTHAGAGGFYQFANHFAAYWMRRAK